MSENKYFDKESQQKALKWLKEKWPREKQKCECCDHNKWTIAQHLIYPLSLGDRIYSKEETYPCVLIVCKNCGNSKLFNAVIMEVLPLENNKINTSELPKSQPSEHKHKKTIRQKIKEYLWYKENV